MTKQIIITPKASLDIDEHFAYIAQGNQEAALKFFDSTRQTFAQLARLPGMGSPYAVNNSSLQGLRKWAIKGFKKYLIFYLEQEDFITIVRILYAAQDIESIFGSEDN
jgi:toxin ParE1/3/4